MELLASIYGSVYTDGCGIGNDDYALTKKAKKIAIKFEVLISVTRNKLEKQ
jgi:hypothetical protein